MTTTPPWLFAPGSEQVQIRVTLPTGLLDLVTGIPREMNGNAERFLILFSWTKFLGDVYLKLIDGLWTFSWGERGVPHYKKTLSINSGHNLSMTCAGRLLECTMAGRCVTTLVLVHSHPM